MVSQLSARAVKPSTTDGDVLTTVSGKTAWAAAGGNSGGVQSVQAGAGIGVDSTDPANPKVALSGAGAILLNAGQTVADYETTTGTTVAAGTLVFQKA